MSIMVTKFVIAPATECGGRKKTTGSGGYVKGRSEKKRGIS